MNSISLTLPWPPTINHYWGRRGNRSFILPKGLEFRKIVYIESVDFHKSYLYEKRLSLHIFAYPPDNRRRDLDNILKALQDALQFAGVYKDDTQIDFISIKRQPEKLGIVKIKINEFNY